MQSIAQIYAALIKEGLKTIEDVPERNRAEVQALVNANADA